MESWHSEVNGDDNIITRAYVSGDSNIALTAVIDQTGTLRLDGSSNNTFQFESHTTKYEFVEGPVTTANYIIQQSGTSTGLTYAIGAEDKLYQIRAQTSGKGLDASSDWSFPISPEAGTGSGKDTAKFVLDATMDSSGTPNNNLGSGTRIVMIYQIDKAIALADSGQEIKMQVSLVTPTDGILVNPARELSIATSKKAIEASMKPMNPGQIRVSVDSESMAFTGTAPGPYISATTAQIGYIDIDTESGIKTADGETDFVLGSTGAEASASTLDIEEGQFAASLSTNGRVFINASSAMDAANATETTAHWDLTNTNLDTITATATGLTTIRFTADGETVINTGNENPPSATLVIDFDAETSEDITVTSELTEIKQDGTICTMYNIPSDTAKDKVNIRITNESSTSDDLICTLRGEDGAIIGTLDSIPCFPDPASVDPDSSIPINSMETKRLTATDLETLAGEISWDGRAVLTIKSSLPKMEVFAMLRSKIPGSPLTNFSTGAHGQGCEQ